MEKKNIFTKINKNTIYKLYTIGPFTEDKIQNIARTIKEYILNYDIYKDGYLNIQDIIFKRDNKIINIKDLKTKEMYSDIVQRILSIRFQLQKKNNGEEKNFKLYNINKIKNQFIKHNKILENNPKEIEYKLNEDIAYLSKFYFKINGPCKVTFKNFCIYSKENKCTLEDRAQYDCAFSKHTLKCLDENKHIMTILNKDFISGYIILNKNKTLSDNYKLLNNNVEVNFSIIKNKKNLKFILLKLCTPYPIEPNILLNYSIEKTINMFHL